MANNIGRQTGWYRHNDLHPLPGDKIEFDRSPVYEHVGIADRNGGIYHFGGEPGMGSGFGSKSRAGFRHDKISQVAKGDKVRINNSDDNKWTPLTSSEIIRRCEAELGKGYGTYSLPNNNCEDKANEMRYGTPFSGQREQVEQVAVASAASGILVVAFMALASLIMGIAGGNREPDREKPARR